MYPLCCKGKIFVFHTGILHPHRFLHPLHNFALVSYDPRDLPPETRRLVRATELAPGPLHRGDAITLAGVTKDLRVMQRKSVVTNSTLALSIHSAEVPRYEGGLVPVEGPGERQTFFSVQAFWIT